PRTTSLRRASQAWALVSTCWLVRAVALFVLVGALGIGYSFPLALLFLCAGAAAAALPIGPAGAATQVGAGAAALLAAGVGASQALGVAVSLGALGVLSGAAILLFAVAGRTVASLLPARAPGSRRLRPPRGTMHRSTTSPTITTAAIATMATAEAEPITPTSFPAASSRNQ